MLNQNNGSFYEVPIAVYYTAEGTPYKIFVVREERGQPLTFRYVTLREALNVMLCIEARSVVLQQRYLVLNNVYNIAKVALDGVVTDDNWVYFCQTRDSFVTWDGKEHSKSMLTAKHKNVYNEDCGFSLVPNLECCIPRIKPELIQRYNLLAKAEKSELGYRYVKQLNEGLTPTIIVPPMCRDIFIASKYNVKVGTFNAADVAYCSLLKMRRDATTAKMDVDNFICPRALGLLRIWLSSCKYFVPPKQYYMLTHSGGIQEIRLDSYTGTQKSLCFEQTEYERIPLQQNRVFITNGGSLKELYMTPAEELFCYDGLQDDNLLVVGQTNKQYEWSEGYTQNKFFRYTSLRHKKIRMQLNIPIGTLALDTAKIDLETPAQSTKLVCNVRDKIQHFLLPDTYAYSHIYERANKGEERKGYLEEFVYSNKTSIRKTTNAEFKVEWLRTKTFEEICKLTDFYTRVDVPVNSCSMDFFTTSSETIDISRRATRVLYFSKEVKKFNMFAFTQDSLLQYDSNGSKILRILFNVPYIYLADEASYNRIMQHINDVLLDDTQPSVVHNAYNYLLQSKIFNLVR